MEEAMEVMYLFVADDEDLMTARGRELFDMRLIAVAHEHALQ